ncbi:RNA polymerase sigma factor [Stutzerimonas chloritidismutans]|uniref:RNA polymerase sigma factor n=1 Tax=Stutzerimonas chloritidismutans TaxID=203192 RepID=UPI003F14C2FA
MPAQATNVAARIEHLYRSESRRVLATLIRLLGDFDRAEEALHDAFAAAVQQWPRDGVPASPRAWLVSAGRFKAIDALRRRMRFDASLQQLADQLEQAAPGEVDEVDDDRLRLIFTCCHPALPPDAQVALTLRQVCDLTTDEIARAFLVAPATIAQRIVRAKARIREARLPYHVPDRDELPERLDSVLRVIYLVFNEGYCATGGDALTRADLCREAIRLGRLLEHLLPNPEVSGLLALMLLHEARRSARVDAAGDLVRLEDQDRSLWEPAIIAEGLALVRQAFRTGRPGPYALQAAIIGVHAEAPSAPETDWQQIIRLYDVLLCVSPSPTIELNRAVALAMHDGPAAGMAVLDHIEARALLKDNHLLHAARADFCYQLGRLDEARRAYRTALSLARLESERRFLQRRLDSLGR